MIVIIADRCQIYSFVFWRVTVDCMENMSYTFFYLKTVKLFIVIKSFSRACSTNRCTGFVLQAL